MANQPDEEGELVEWHGVWAGQFPAARGIANFATEWAGKRWTMLVWPLPNDEVARARLLLHESFHNAQFELNLSSGGSGVCSHLDTYDGRLWVRLEARALAAALRSSIDGREEARDEAARDAMLFRAMRRSLFPDAAENEDGLERLEGSAEYTGVRLCSPDARVRTEAAVGLLEGLRDRPSLTRSFQYATGPALGLLLDDHDPYWREAFLAGSSLSAMLAPAVWFEGGRGPGARAPRPRARHGVRVRAGRRRGDAARGGTPAPTRAVSRALPRRTGARPPPPASPQTSFDPSRIEILEGVGSVYGTLWLSDAWGVADAPGGGLILEDGTVRLAAPSDVEGPQLAGDGWTLELATGWSVAPGKRDGDWCVVPGGG